jgi:hypothetical protein
MPDRVVRRGFVTVPDPISPPSTQPGQSVARRPFRWSILLAASALAVTSCSEGMLNPHGPIAGALDIVWVAVFTIVYICSGLSHE